MFLIIITLVFYVTHEHFTQRDIFHENITFILSFLLRMKFYWVTKTRIKFSNLCPVLHVFALRHVFRLKFFVNSVSLMCLAFPIHLIILEFIIITVRSKKYEASFYNSL